MSPFSRFSLRSDGFLVFPAPRDPAAARDPRNRPGPAPGTQDGHPAPATGTSGARGAATGRKGFISASEVRVAQHLVSTEAPVPRAAGSLLVPLAASAGRRTLYRRRQIRWRGPQHDALDVGDVDAHSKLPIPNATVHTSTTGHLVPARACAETCWHHSGSSEGTRTPLRRRGPDDEVAVDVYLAFNER